MEPIKITDHEGLMETDFALQLATYIEAVAAMEKLLIEHDVDAVEALGYTVILRGAYGHPAIFPTVGTLKPIPPPAPELSRAWSLEQRANGSWFCFDGAGAEHGPFDSVREAQERLDEDDVPF